MENSAELGQATTEAPRDKTALAVIEDNLNEEASCLVNIDSRLTQLLGRLRGSLPEGLSKDQEKVSSQGSIGSIRERTEGNIDLAARIQSQVNELEGIL